MRYEYALEWVKGIRESFNNATPQMIEAYMDNRLVDIYSTTEVFEIYTSTEAMSGAKQLGDTETPPLLSINDGYSITVTENRFGGGIELTEDEYRREVNDMSTKVYQILQRKQIQLLTSVKHTFLTDMFSFFNSAFAGQSGPLAPDGVAFCGTHSWKTAGAATWSNYFTNPFSSDAVDTIVQYGSEFQDAAGRPMPQIFNQIVVKLGSPAAREAKRLFAMHIQPIAVADINIYEGEFTIVETPYISNRNYWFMRAVNDPNGNALKMGIGEYPTLREPIRQNNESILTNCTSFWKKAICNLPYSWAGSDSSGS